MKILSKLTGIALILLFSVSGCKEDKPLDNLVVSRTDFNFESEGGTATLLLQTDASEWRIQNPADWISVSPTMGEGPSANITLTVDTKKMEPRTEILTILAGTAEPIEVTVSQAAADFLYALTSSTDELSFKKGGSSVEINITTDAPDWEITSDAEWLQFTPSTGGAGTVKVTATALANSGSEPRAAAVSLSAEYAPSVEISASQIGEYYPSYNTSPLPPDDSGMGSTAVELAAKMSLGWNIGNTLEAIGGETAWGNPMVTESLIQLVKSNGFDAIRIPCSWDQNMSDPSKAEISTQWLNRVKEVVQYCVDNDMYVLLNIHWDGGWLENNVTPASQEENNAKQKAFWEQIATHLRDFDEHLMFAGTNEPNVENATQMAVLNSYHQTFIDAVRATGGRNSYRVLVVQGPSTDVEKTYELMSSLPTDPTPNRMMAEIHYYTPYQFCLMEEDASWGNMFYYWGEGYHSTTDTERNATWGEEADVDRLLGLMKAKFVNNGIPVILGEYAVGRRLSLTGEDLELHLASRAYYLEYVTRQARANEIIPFYWDAGGLGNNGSGLFNRAENTVFDQQALDALVEGATE